MKIYSHDTDEQITHKNNITELNTWTNHLQYIDKEILNFNNLSLINQERYRALGMIERLEKKRQQNLIQLQNLEKYAEQLRLTVECEDVACDMFFISSHENYRKEYMHHLKAYRELKEDFFDKLMKK